MDQYEITNYLYNEDRKVYLRNWEPVLNYITNMHKAKLNNEFYKDFKNTLWLSTYEEAQREFEEFNWLEQNLFLEEDFATSEASNSEASC